MMEPRTLLPLAVALLMFAQIAQTLLSPALTDIGQAYDVSPQALGQILSVFFVAFAAGVVVWGRACDRIGRRRSLLCGLLVYSLAILLALYSRTFMQFLFAQGLAAFGVAVGSVVTQTVLRDRYQGAELARVFSLIGMALAASPAIGLFSGASLVQWFGYRGVLLCLLLLASLLIGWCWRALPETRPPQLTPSSLVPTLSRMLRDQHIWRVSLLVALFNIGLFSYYSLGPFLFQGLGLSMQTFGYSGALLALGSGLGAWSNKRLLSRGWRGEALIRAAALLLLLGGLGVWLGSSSMWFVLPMLLVVWAFGMAIPNLLGAALVSYSHCLGTAGALFGLLYYLLIGVGLMLAGWAQALGETLVVCGVFALLILSARREPER